VCARARVRACTSVVLTRHESKKNCCHKHQWIW